MFGYRLSTDGHIRGQGCRRGLTSGDEQVQQLAASRIRHRFPQVVVIRCVLHRDECPEAKSSRKRSP